MDAKPLLRHDSDGHCDVLIQDSGPDRDVRRNRKMVCCELRRLHAHCLDC